MWGNDQTKSNNLKHDWKTYDDHVNEIVVGSIPTSNWKHKKSNTFPASNSPVVHLNQRTLQITQDNGKSSEALEYILFKYTFPENGKT